MFEYIQAHQLHDYLYFGIFLAMFVDANITVFASAFLVSGGAVLPVPTIILLAVAAYAEQLLYFWLGGRLAGWRRLVRQVERISERLDGHIRRNLFHSLFVSKFIYGFHRAVLLRSGMMRLPVREFLRAAAMCSLAWLAILGSLAFAFSASYQQVKEYIRFAELLPLSLVILFFLLQRIFSKNLQSRL